MNIIPHEVLRHDKEKPDNKEHKAKWREKAYACKHGQEHNFIPASWRLSAKSKSVSMLLCLRCFHEVNVSEAFEFRD